MLVLLLRLLLRALRVSLDFSYLCDFSCFPVTVGAFITVAIPTALLWLVTLFVTFATFAGSWSFDAF